jgi:hypothetical protein
MIRLVGKKSKQRTEQIADRKITAEADYFARKCGLTREEAQRIIDEARIRTPIKPAVAHVKDR